MTLTLLTSTIISTSEIEAAFVVHGACNMVFTLGLRPFYAPQVFVAKNHPNFEQRLWRFVNESFATVFNDA